MATTTTVDLRSALSKALVLADGEAISAAGLLIDAVARHLGIDPETLEIGVPLAGREQWCPVCTTMHALPIGERTDAGVYTRACPRVPTTDPRYYDGVGHIYTGDRQ